MARWYDSIYAQFSSVSHFDMYSIELLGLHKAPDEKLVLATNPYWPALLILQNCLFDIVQCSEAAHAYFHLDVSDVFNEIFLEWTEITRKMELAPSSPAKEPGH